MILVYDIGTSVLKAALLEDDAVLKGMETRRFEFSKNAAPGHFEADTEAWVSAFADATRTLLSKYTSGAAAVPDAVVISGNGPTLVPVSLGRLLEPAMYWMDRRAVKESEEINKFQEFYIDPGFYLPKALWIAGNRPDIYKQADYFLSCPESMVYLLTGVPVTVLPGARFEKYFWSNELLESLGLDKSKFPEFRKPGFTAGAVTSAASKTFGLPQGIPVIAGGPDFLVSQLGAAAVSPGRACDRAGTSEGINLCTEHYIPDTRLMSYGHVAEPWFNVSGIISTSGKSLEWAKGILGGKSVTGSLRERPSKLIFLPYLAGERAPHWDPAARGSFIGLGLETTREQMMTAVMESVGFAIRDVLEVMAENGAECDELRITGGPARNELWNRIKADVSGKRILVPEASEPELTGCLVFAVKELGMYSSLAEAADRLVRIKKVYEPDMSKYNEYTEMFRLYRQSYQALKSVYKGLAENREVFNEHR